MAEIKATDAVAKTPWWLINGAAAFVAVAGALTAIFSFTLTETGNKALRLKSQALDRKTLAVRAWNEHQAVRTKQNIAQLAVQLLPPEKAAPYRARLSRYPEEISRSAAAAQRMEEEADRFDDQSETLLEPRQLQILALILLQVSVTLGSITILAKSRTMFALAGLTGAGGTAIAVAGVLLL